MQLPTVSVHSISAPRQKSPVLANLEFLFHTTDGYILVRDFRILQNKQGKVWLAPPDFPIGQNKYRPTIEFGGTLGEDLSSLGVAAFQRWVEANPMYGPVPAAESEQGGAL